MHEFDALDGALLIDKPVGPTSHDVVDAIRRQFRIKKVGHCGTLDPNATGLLLIVLGRGTKLSSWVFTFVKNYCFDVLKRRRLPTVSLDAGEDGATIPIPSRTQSPRN